MAERDEVVGGKLIATGMHRVDVVDFQVVIRKAGLADWLLLQMAEPDGFPFSRT